MKIHANLRSLYEEWEEKHNEKKEQIKKAKIKRDKAATDSEYDQIDDWMRELYTESNLIHHFLADLGPMLYIEEQRTKIRNEDQRN